MKFLAKLKNILPGGTKVFGYGRPGETGMTCEYGFLIQFCSNDGCIGDSNRYIVCGDRTAIVTTFLPEKGQTVDMFVEEWKQHCIQQRGVSLEGTV